MNIDMLTVKELMELQVQVNNRVEQIKAEAYNALTHDHEFAGFALKQGRVSRVIKDMDNYSHILHEHLGDNAYKVTPIPLTTAEKLIKTQFDKDDACSILEALNKTYGTKVSPPTLVYTGEFND